MRRHAAGSAPEGAPAPPRLLFPILLLALGCVAYAGSLHAPFTFDDRHAIRDNRLIRDLGNWGPGGPGYQSNPNRYLGNVSFAVNYRVGGLEVLGYHAVNVTIHLALALLVYALVVGTFRTPRLAASRLAGWSRPVGLAAAALFVSHPLQTEAVTYVVQRYTSLAALLYVLAAVLYARWRLDPGVGRLGSLRRGGLYALALGAAVLAMKTKETAATWPAAILLYEICFFGRPTGKRLLALVPVAATAAVIPLSIWDLSTPMGQAVAAADRVTHVETSLPRLDYLRTQATVLVSYLRLLAWPAGQNLDHDHPIYRSFIAPPVLASATVLVALVAAAVLLLRATPRTPSRLDAGWRLVAFGIAWFFVTILVESSVIPIRDVMAERRVYLPSVGIFAAVAAGGFLLASRMSPAHGYRNGLVGALAISAVLAVATTRRNAVWSDEAALWADVVAKSPGKSRAHCNLGSVLGAAGREEQAIAELKEAVRLDPGYVEAHNDLGAALAAVGRTDEAIGSLRTAIRIDPTNADAYYNLGRVYLENLGEYGEASELLAKAAVLDPGHVKALANLAAALNRLGRYADSIRLLEGRADVVKESPEAHFNLGVAYAATGEIDRARREVAAVRFLSATMASRLAEYVDAQRLGR